MNVGQGHTSGGSTIICPRDSSAWSRMVAAHPYFPGAGSTAGGDMQQLNVGHAVNQTSPVIVRAPNWTLSRTLIVSSTQPAVEGDVRQPIEIRPTDEVPRTPARRRTPLPNRLSVVAYNSQESIADVETKTESEGNSGRQTIEVQTDVSLTVEGHVWVKTVLLSKAAFPPCKREENSAEIILKCPETFYV